MVFDYPCPDCRTATNLHETGCDYADTDRAAIEKAYTDILTVLSGGARTKRGLRDAAHEWSGLHDEALSLLRYDGRVREVEMGLLELPTPEQRREESSEPTVEPIKTVFEHGSVPGCHDNAVFAMVSWHEMNDFPWDETRERVADWLRETGAWDRGGFEETTPEEVVDSKRHVHEHGYGWKEKATAAKRVIDQST